MTSIVVHYQEIALKGKNRPWFIGRLVRNLRRALSDLDVRAVRTLMGRIEVVLGPDAVPRDGERADLAASFGIANFSYARRGRRSTSTHLTARDSRATSTDRTCRQLPRLGCAAPTSAFR